MRAALRSTALLLALVARMEVAAQPADDLFSRLDDNGDGYLGATSCKATTAR